MYILIIYLANQLLQCSNLGYICVLGDVPNLAQRSPAIGTDHTANGALDIRFNIKEHRLRKSRLTRKSIREH